MVSLLSSRWWNLSFVLIFFLEWRNGWREGVILVGELLIMIISVVLLAFVSEWEEFDQGRLGITFDCRSDGMIILGWCGTDFEVDFWEFIVVGRRFVGSVLIERAGFGVKMGRRRTRTHGSQNGKGQKMDIFLLTTHTLTSLLSSPPLKFPHISRHPPLRRGLPRRPRHNRRNRQPKHIPKPIRAMVLSRRNAHSLLLQHVFHPTRRIDPTLATALDDTVQ